MSHPSDQLSISLDVPYGINKTPSLFFTVLFYINIREVTRVALFPLRRVAWVIFILSLNDAEVLVCAFVTSKLDALLSGLPICSIAYLFNYDHTSPVLASLQWFPVKGRADFKVPFLLFIFN